MYSCNILESEQRSCLMADPRVDKLEQQFASIKAMIEGLVKKSDDQARRMEENNSKVDTLLSKGGNVSGSEENSNS